MGNIYKYDVPFGSSNVTGNASGIYQINGGATSLDAHLIWGQAFNGTKDVDGNLTITNGNIELMEGNAHIGCYDESGGNLTVDKHTTTNTLKVNGTADINSLNVANAVDIDGNLNVDKKAVLNRLEVNISADVGGSIWAGGNMIAEGDINSGGCLMIGQDADIAGTTNTGIISAVNGDINNIISKTITTDRLEVLKSAKFYEVVVQELKSIGGSVILSPADGFVVSEVESYTKSVSGKHFHTTTQRWATLSFTATCYKLYWNTEKDDNGTKINIDNKWQKGDMMICHSFNIKEGTSQNVATKYYWCVVTDVGITEPTRNEPRKNWIEIIDSDDYYYPEKDRPSTEGNSIVRPVPNCTFKEKDCIVNPGVGDNVAHLGNVYANYGNNRGDAIYISAVMSNDRGLSGPFIATYKGIDSYNLESHRHSQLSPSGNFLRGTFYAGNDDRPIDEVMGEIAREINGKIGTLEQGHENQQATISSLSVSTNNIKSRVEQVETGYSELKQTFNGFTTTVNNAIDNHSTQIRQNADQISIYADEIEKLKIDKDKIVLNGDTEVNGTVKINQDGVGFTLSGSNGERFDIISKTIGNYDTFSSDNNVLLHAVNKTVQLRATTTVDLNNRDESTGPWSNMQRQVIYTAQSLGVIKQGTQLTINKLKSYIDSVTATPMHQLCKGEGKVNSFGIRISTSNSIGDTVAMSGTYAAEQNGDVLTYMVTKTKEYFVIGQVDMTVTSTIHEKNSTDTTPQPVRCTAAAKAIISCNVYGSDNAHGIVAYDGLGINFGGGKVCFMGNDCGVIKYGGNSAIKISADGLQKLVPQQITNHSLYPDGRRIVSNYQNAGQWVSLNAANTINYTNTYISTCIASTKDSSYKILCLNDDDEFVTLYTSYLVEIRLPNPVYVSPGHKITIKRIDGGNVLYRKTVRIYAHDGTTKFYGPGAEYVAYYDINEKTATFISNGVTWVMD